MRKAYSGNFKLSKDTSIVRMCYNSVNIFDLNYYFVIHIADITENT